MEDVTKILVVRKMGNIITKIILTTLTNKTGEKDETDEGLTGGLWEMIEAKKKFGEKLGMLRN
jgi:hypothetical protein